MSGQSKIEWTDRTWNPVRGCSMVSAGCENCYAMKQAHRFSGKGQPYEGLTEVGPQGVRWNGTVRLVHEALNDPLKWRKPQRIFVNSMSDLFHDAVSDEFIDQVFAAMFVADWHIYQVLTKRPQRMSDYLIRNNWEDVGFLVACQSPLAAIRALQRKERGGMMLEHVWLGVSVEDQQAADERIPILLQTPAAVRFVSAEPLLGPVDLQRQVGWLEPFKENDPMLNKTPRLDWVIIGGESGPKARPMHHGWARSIRDQCQETGTPFFMKQIAKKAPIPGDLLVRDFPK